MEAWTLLTTPFLGGRPTAPGGGRIQSMIFFFLQRSQGISPVHFTFFNRQGRQLILRFPIPIKY
jgi:hypothetical protein